MKKRAEKIWTLLVCILLFANGMVSCDSSDLDKLPQNENLRDYPLIMPG